MSRYVIPAKAGIQNIRSQVRPFEQGSLDSRFRGNDGILGQLTLTLTLSRKEGEF